MNECMQTDGSEKWVETTFEKYTDKSVELIIICTFVHVSSAWRFDGEFFNLFGKLSTTKVHPAMYTRYHAPEYTYYT